MSTMHISLPDALRDFVNDQVNGHGYTTASEYVRALIRRDQDRRHLRAWLLDGAASAQAVTADADHFDRLRKSDRR